MGSLLRLGFLLLHAMFIGLMVIAAKVGMATIKMIFIALKQGKMFTEIGVKSIVTKIFNKEKGKLI